MALSLAALAIAATAGCAISSELRQQALPCTIVGTSDFADVESAAHEQVNRRRTRIRLPPLRLDPRISEAARRHSSDMAAGRVPVSHDGFSDRIRGLATCLRVRAAFENVTVIQTSRSTAGLIAVEEWMDSPTHRENILRDHDTSGVGVVLGTDGYFYITQIYLRTQ